MKMIGLGEQGFLLNGNASSDAYVWGKWAPFWALFQICGCCRDVNKCLERIKFPMSQNTYASLDVLPSSKSAMGLGVQILGIHCTSDLVAPPIIYFISESKDSLSKGF